MVLIISITAFLLVTILFVIDTAKDQSTTSEVSTYLSPFESETFVSHNYSASVETVWNAVVNLASYNYWFPGIARILPIVKTDRYVHRYSFDQFNFAPGSLLTIKNRGVFPSGKGMIASATPNKKLEMVLQYNPLHKEYVTFDLASHSEGTTLSLTRKSYGPFSFMSVWGFDSSKSKTLDNLGYMIPAEDIASEDKKEVDSKSSDASDNLFEDRNLMAAYLVNKTLDGDANIIKSTVDVYARGKAKALLIKINKGTAERPPMPEAGASAPASTQPAASQGSNDAVLSKEDTIAMVVNKALDGDEGPLNELTDKVLRAKSKSLIMKINKGTAERPPMPEAGASAPASTQPAASQGSNDAVLSKEDTIAMVVNKALDGDEGPLNELTDKVLRAKSKSLIMKINKGTAERPPMPEADSNSSDEKPTNKNDEILSETDEDKFARMVAEGIKGNMEEINSLEDKILRGKIKAAIVKAKRSS